MKSIKKTTKLPKKEDFTLDEYLENLKKSNDENSSFKNPNNFNNLLLIISNLAKSSLDISLEINETRKDKKTQKLNGSGEKLSELKIKADKSIKRNLSDFVDAIATEDSGLLYKTDFANSTLNNLKENKKGLILTSDSIDGSSNINTNGSLSSIFSVLPSKTTNKQTSEKDFFQKGENLLFSALSLYSSKTGFIFSIDQQPPLEFLYNKKENKFIFTRIITIPNTSKYFSVNIGNLQNFKDQDRNFLLDYIINKERMSFRYSGSAGIDIRRILSEGGIFMYPQVNLSTKKDQPNFQPKLRALYENNPLAYLTQSAGGFAFNQEGKRILEIPISNLNQKGSLYLGNSMIKKRFE